jgi:hypothetical protein
VSDLPRQGTCYGYEIRSALEFNYLRSGAGEPLEVSPEPVPDQQPGELLRTWDPPGFPVRVRLYSSSTGYGLWNEDAGWFGIEPSAPRLVVPPSGDPVRREERVWGLPVMLCFLARGDLALHASCVEVDNRALVLAAPRRFGKTTLAAGFASVGYRVLAEDLVCIRPGSPPSVVPGPAMLRVRRDIGDSLSVPGAVELGRDDDRIHLSLQAQRGTCDPVPLGGIAMLLEGDTEPRTDPIDSASVVPDLWYLSFKLSNEDDMSRCFGAITQVAYSTRAWNLTRRLQLDELNATVESLLDAFRSS